MCGIAGIINFNGPEDKALLLRRMIGLLRHRGPDAAGIYTNEIAGLAHARLSIIDLTSGDQPIHNEDKTLWIVFNGEIFNYPELRADLVNRGHRFYTQTDTEVLIHLYEEKGVDMFNDLNGQFALAIWDTKQNKLIMSRDRVGIRPLFYHLNNSRLVFGSEIKSLFADQAIPRYLDPRVLSDIFTAWTCMDSQTPFQGIHQVPPGHYAVLTTNGLKVESYWRLSFSEMSSKLTDMGEWTENLNDLLLDATRIRLRADVPVGAYLSGGIDSTYISSLVKHHFNNQLSTFSVTFTNDRYDETSFQKTAIQALNTDHKEIRCSEHGIGETFPDIVWHTEMPIFRTAPAPLHQLSKLVRQNDYKVVLTGEGADEIFGGYNIFKEDRVRRFWARNPNSTMRPALLGRLYPYIFNRADTRSKIYLINYFRKNLTEIDLPHYSHVLRWQNTSQIKNFFAEDFRKQMPDLDDTIERYVATLPKDFMTWHPLSRAQYTEISLFMSNYLLSSQGDRMAMANSVEGRYPYLDHRVMEFACRMPAKFKLNGLNEKYILKKAAEGKVPDEIVNRPKQPYRAPMSGCFFGKERLDYVEEMLSEDKIRNYGYFDDKKVTRLKAKCQKRGGELLSERENMAVVGILSTQLLHHNFIENFPAHPVQEPKGVKIFH